LEQYILLNFVVFLNIVARFVSRTSNSQTNWVVHNDGGYDGGCDRYSSLLVRISWDGNVNEVEVERMTDWKV